jgi:hypothetical protein
MAKATERVLVNGEPVQLAFDVSPEPVAVMA